MRPETVTYQRPVRFALAGADDASMRRLLLLTTSFALALFAMTLAGTPQVTAGTPVTVLAADRVVLLLPVSPTTDRIVTDLRAELFAMGTTETDPRIVSALQRAARDDGLLTSVAASPVDMFSSGAAIATATPLFDVSLSKERVIVTTITVELVPGYGSTATSRDHEDGHALINEKIADRCAAESLITALGTGYQGEDLIKAMSWLINQAADPVHTRYHTYVKSAEYGQHIRYAGQALQDVAGCQFNSSGNQ